ncbi:MAG: acyl-CoA synthetase [Gaiellaceae bacterium]
MTNDLATLPKTDANYVPLSPLSFLSRAALTYPERRSLIHGRHSWTWAETAERCLRLASGLKGLGVEPGDTVAVLAPNIPALYEAHFGVPMAGAVLNAINTRLDPATVAYILEHGEAKVVLVDRELAGLASAALESSERSIAIVDIDDPLARSGEPIGQIEYEELLAGADATLAWELPTDEWDAISINYTSGTTGQPKGVVYHHRGAYLNALANAITWELPHHPTYLWTLPMFHCNGWCFTWTLAAMGGTSVCLRRVETEAMYAAIAEHRVSHLCGAPIVMQLLLDGTDEQQASFDHRVRMMTAAAPPPAAVLAGMHAKGFEVTHVYGLTETYGPVMVCAPQEDWAELSDEQLSARMARQGVRYLVQEDVMVASPDSLEPVAKDGKTIGEVMIRGNIAMKGYLKEPDATATALAGGWLHTGDLGVWHPDSYVELKDRSKDIIISGGENISSIEVENALYRHHAVTAVAVVAKPDERWGETPCAFVELRVGAVTTENELIEFCREHLAGFKCPREIRFEELPKTSTGKVQKHVLRRRLEGAGASDGV